MSTIANAKVEHNYNRYNGYFFGCLLFIRKSEKTFILGLFIFPLLFESNKFTIFASCVYSNKKYKPSYK